MLVQRHWSQTCIQHHILGPFCRQKSLSKITRIHPAKKAKDEKNLCAEGTVAAVSIYETRNCISKRIQEFSPLRKLLTRIRNKPYSIYRPLNWKAPIEIILHSAGLCPAKSWQVSDLAISEVWITSPAFRPIIPLLLILFFSFLQFTYLFYLFTSSSYPLSLLLFPYYSPFYLPTLFSFHSYICLKDQNLTATQLSYCNDKKHSWRNSVLEKHLGEEFLYLQLCFAFIVACYTANTCGDCSERRCHITPHSWKRLNASTSKLKGI